MGQYNTYIQFSSNHSLEIVRNNVRNALLPLGGDVVSSTADSFVLVGAKRRVFGSIGAKYISEVIVRKNNEHTSVKIRSHKSPNGWFWICLVSGFMFLAPWFVNITYFFSNPNKKLKKCLANVEHELLFLMEESFASTAVNSDWGQWQATPNVQIEQKVQSEVSSKSGLMVYKIILWSIFAGLPLLVVLVLVSSKISDFRERNRILGLHESLSKQEKELYIVLKDENTGISEITALELARLPERYRDRYLKKLADAKIEQQRKSAEQRARIVASTHRTTSDRMSRDSSAKKTASCRFMAEQTISDRKRLKEYIRVFC